MNRGGNTRLAVIAGFAALLLIPSFDTVLKYAGAAGLICYFLFGTAGLYLLDRFLVEGIIARVGQKAVLFTAFFVFAVLIAIAAIGYPIANSGRFGGGSDIDDAMLIGAGEILAGRYPYYPQTYLGGYLSPMPGTLLFAIPFVAAGLLPYQNVFWLAVLFFASQKFFKSAAPALGLIVTPLLTNPTFYQVLVTGSDHAANSIYVLVGIWATVRSVSHERTPWWKKVLAASFLGVGLSSRSVFLFLVPLVFSVLVQNSGLREALKYVGLALVVFAAVTLPFFLYDPPAFSPLIVQAQKTRMLENVVPHAGFVIGGSALVLSLILSLQKMTNDCRILFRNAAVVQIFMLLFASIVWMIYVGQLSLFVGTIGYGMFTLFFATASVWIFLAGRFGSSFE
jgi:hypothetical protein